MRKLLLLFIIIIPSILLGQSKDRLSRAYIGAQLHEAQPGLSLTNSFGLNQFFGIGAGVDLTSYDGEILAPIYLDIRGRYAIGQWEPFLYGQFGKNLYKKNDAVKYIDPTGRAFTYDKNGKLFYGGGIGAAYSLGQFSLFVSYTNRQYKYKYGEVRDIAVNPSIIDENANILTVGFVF